MSLGTANYIPGCCSCSSIKHRIHDVKASRLSCNACGWNSPWQNVEVKVELDENVLWFALSSHIILFAFFFPQRIIFFFFVVDMHDSFRLLLVYLRKKCSLKKMRCFMTGWKTIFIQFFNQRRMNPIKSRKNN